MSGPGQWLRGRARWWRDLPQETRLKGIWGVFTLVLVPVIVALIPVVFAEDDPAPAPTAAPAFTTMPVTTEPFVPTDEPTAEPSADDETTVEPTTDGPDPDEPTDDPATDEPVDELEESYLIDRIHDEIVDDLSGAGSFAMSGEQYDRSVKKGCFSSRYEDTQVWSSSGFKRLVAVIGVADDEGGAIGVTGTVHLRDQDGRELTPPFKIRLGKPHKVDISLRGAVQMQIDCYTSSDDDHTFLTLGDARFVG